MEISKPEGEFLEDPVKLLNNEPEILDKGNFFGFGGAKSSFSTNFILNGETYVVWTSKMPGGEWGLSIYNITLKKLEDHLLVGSKVCFHYLSTYPIEANSDSKKWLYCTDDEGLIRIFNINEKPFKEIKAFRPQADVNKWAIYSALIFDDKFNEISESESSQKTFVMVSFQDPNIPLTICDLDGKTVREIERPFDTTCLRMNLYYDKDLGKTHLFCGFTSSAVAMYDLKNKAWGKMFAANNQVTSINCLTRIVDSKPIKYVVYTQVFNSKISIGKIDGKEEDIQEINVPNVFNIFDLCVWNENSSPCVLVTACFSAKGEPPHFICLVDLEEGKVLEEKVVLDDFQPVNVMKVQFKAEGKYKEGIVVFAHRGGGVILYK